MTNHEARLSPVVALRKSMAASLKSLGEMRDGFLVLASLTYVLGYVSWALYASRHGLGLIPAFDTQYLMAGLVPVAGLFVFICVARLLFALNAWRAKPLPPGAAKWVQRLSSAGAICIGLGFLAYVPALRAQWAILPLIIAGVALFYVSTFFERGRLDRIMQVFSIVVAWAYLVIFGVALPIVYFGRVFELVPQEWGGPGARLVAFDVEADELSAPMKELLVAPADSASTEDVVRTKLVRLVFEGSEFVYFFPRTRDPISAKDVFRLRREHIVAVIPAVVRSAGADSVAAR